MGKKIVIHHGEAVVEHELGDKPVVIGRDPGCELFFEDRKLSRRHARIEFEGTTIKLVDLGSRNGSWVNEEQVIERVLGTGDEVRLGSLHIEVVLESPPNQLDESAPSSDDEVDDQTIVLGAGEDRTVVLEQAPDETVVLGAESEAEADELSGDTTVIPNTDATMVPAGDDTVRPVLEDTQKTASPDATQMVSVPPLERAPETGTVAFRLPDEKAPLAGEATPDTRAADEATVLLAGRAETPAPMPQAPAAARAGQPSAPRWVAPAVALVAVCALAIPMMLIAMSLVLEESRLRGDALAELLAATGRAAITEDDASLVAHTELLSQPGVSGAWVLDADGLTVVPADERGRTPELGVTLSPNENEIELPGGERLLTRDILADGERVGVAVIRYRASTGSGWMLWTLLVGLLVTAAAVVATAVVVPSGAGAN